jgi:hypothetical protein
MKNILVGLFLIFSFNITNGQFLKIGIRIEPALLLTEQNSSSDYGFALYSFYLSTTFRPIENLSIEVRPGYFMGNEYYGGFEIGAFLKWSIMGSKYFLVGGLNNHYNSWLGSHNGGSGILKTMLFKGIGIGYQKDSKLSFDIMYYWTSDKEFAYSRNTDWLTYSKTVNNKMNGILKIGFNISFTII